MPYNSDYNKRYVPVYVWLVLIFGRFATNFGLIFMGFALTFNILLSPVVKVEKLSDNSPTVKGVVVAIEPTKSSVNDQRVFAYSFKFTTPQVQEITGLSYSEKFYLEIGDTVDIQYSPIDPNISRIQGMRSGEIGVWILLIFLPFLFVGFGFVLFGVIRAYRQVSILRYGVVAYGKLVKKEETSSRVNYSPVFRLYFDFITSKKEKITTVCRTHKVDLLDEEKQNKLLYNPSNPQKTIFFALMPKILRNFLKRIE
jgi:hypothetical protein